MGAAQIIRMLELTLNERELITKLFAKKYELASRPEKVQIIEQFVAITGYRRDSASRAFRKIIKNSKMGIKPKPPGRKTYYGPDVQQALIKIWKTMDYICSKRLVAALPVVIPALEGHGHLELEPTVRTKLLKVKPATVDRLLASARRSLGRKGTSATRPGKYLIDQIPIKTFTEWTHTDPGHIQMDLVAHNGGDVFGGFLYTLNATDVATGWTTCTLVRDKTKFQMLKSIARMRLSFPFKIHSIHSDNGAEFINDTILKYTQRKGLSFTRGRPYKKNDGAIIEQKNYSVVRRNTGYLRYDKPEHGPLLNSLYLRLNIYNNYFMPSMQLLEKQRRGAKVHRRHDYPATPYQRLLTMLNQKERAIMEQQLKDANLASLKHEINEIQGQLIKSAAPIHRPVKPKRIRRKKILKHVLPENLRQTNGKSPNPFLERQRLEEMRRAANTVWERRRNNG